MKETILPNSFIFDLINATESASIASYKMLGKGKEKIADQLAVDAMRNSLNMLNIDGTVVIGEGERDEAPMLYIGEKVGKGIGPQIDIALDPLEGTTLLATGKNNALSVIGAANKGNFLNAPDVYMDKIAIGFDFAEDIIDLNNSPLENLKNIALAKKCDISDLIVTVLERKRHEELIAKIYEAGARVLLIQDGDIGAVISTSSKAKKISDIYMGIGGAPEGVLAAAAMKSLGGQMSARLLFNNEDEKARAQKLGIKDLNKQYKLHDMAKGDVIFVATAITDGSLIEEGIKVTSDELIITSIAMNSRDKSIYKLASRKKRW